MKLGFATEDLEVEVRRDADFNAVIRRRTSVDDATAMNWDDGTEIEIRIGDGPDPDVWAASVSNENAVFHEDAATVNTVLDTDVRIARLFYKVGPVELCWAVGALITRTQP